MRRGRLAEAAAELAGFAFDGEGKDPEVPNALAFALMQTDRPSEAVAVLRKQQPHGIPTISTWPTTWRGCLATAPNPQVRDGALALRMALEIREIGPAAATRGCSIRWPPRKGQSAISISPRQTASEGAARARQLGDLETAESDRRPSVGATRASWSNSICT